MSFDEKDYIEIEFSLKGIKRENYIITSPKANYNCIAYAASNDSKWWWPINSYWPKGIKREETLDSFTECYGTLGYEVCDNGLIEEGFEKIAIYCNNYGLPTHASKQKFNSKFQWESKLGSIHDIEHSVNAFEGTVYGNISVFMKRKILTV
ncbi:hypothetical protein BH10BAC5_BH10BAC5_26990 [soil metagenome]